MALTGSFGDLYVRQYRDLIEHELQQKGSVLRGVFNTESITSSLETWFPKIGKVSSYEVTGRNQDVDLEDQTNERRGLTLQLIESSKQIEAIDLARYARSPQPELVEAMARELGRQIDVVVMTALAGSALRQLDGSASNASFAAANTIAVNTNTFGMESAAGTNLTGDTGLHEGKILQALNLLQASYALQPGDRPIVIAPSIQLTGLKSRAFKGTNAALFQKDIPNVHIPMADKALSGFLGCEYIQYQDTGVDGSSDQYVYIVLPQAVKLAIFEEVSFRTKLREEKKGNPTLMKANMTLGAVRMWEEAVVRVLCDPTPTYALA
jgi:hypothetical protein